jgi:putative peptide zinc metalloprotease protein
MRRVFAIAVTWTLFLALPAAAGGPNNVVQASPTADGAKIYRVGIRAASTGADSITSTNLATANPHDCTGCDGRAVAFQALILTGSPTTFKPTNAAVAVNSSCTSCIAYAYAGQYAIQADRGTHLSSTGRARIKDIRQRATSTVSTASIASLEDAQALQAKLDALFAEFKAAVYNDLERTGADPHDGSRDIDTDEAPADE